MAHRAVGPAQGMKMKEPDYSDLLVKFELDNIPDYYKEYYGNKRHNFFATIQQFPYLWACYLSLDKIWQSEFETIENIGDPSLMFPMILYISGHAKGRVAFELGCSACLAEARSILRDAIEATAHGHRLASNPDLIPVWLKKDEDDTTRKLYKQQFEENKAERLFNGLSELHKLWRQFSEFGSHTNLNSLVERFEIKTTDTHLQYKCNYTGSRPEILIPALFEMILTFHQMEAALFRVCEGRLKLALNIPGMRRDFEAEKERVRRRIITEFKIKPPGR
jgi:hypothetical protein